MRPISQFRFVQTVLPGATTTMPALSQEVKYLAVYKMDDGRLAVLAQGKDKYTLKKWAGILRARQAGAVSVVDDMTAALEFARAQEGFEEHGRFTYCKTGGGGSQALNKKKPAVNNTQQPPPEVLPGKKPTANNQKLHDEYYNTPGYIMARQVGQKRLRYLEEVERFSSMIMSDASKDEEMSFLDVDIDRVPQQGKPRMTLQECCERGRQIARQTALNYLQRLEHEGQLTHACIVPPALREEFNAIKKKKESSNISVQA